MSLSFRYPIMLAVLVVVPATGQPAPEAVTRLAGPVHLDGVVGEPAWQAVPALPLVQQSPVYGLPPTQRTRLRIAYDDEFLYASAEMSDANPSGIRGNSLVRDGNGPTDDIFAIIVDTFNDNENALGFTVSASGNRGDFSVFKDAEMMGDAFPFNESWNTFWDAAVVVHDSGWSAELRIPWSSLRFEDDDGTVTMGVIAWRYNPRVNETDIFPDIPPHWAMSMLKASRARDMRFDGVRSRMPLYITPYALGGGGFLHELRDDSSAYDRSDQRKLEAGLDVKLGLTSNLTLDVTVNTDFAQVEADDQQVNLTRFSLFFPEKRLFFQERSSIFDYSIGGPFRLFYSRQIGLSEEQGPVRIFGGVRMVGRVGAWDLGFLEMQTARAVDLPSENFGVLRLRRRIVNQFSNLGVMLTSRTGNDGSYNYVYGVDADVRVIGDDYATLNMAQSFDDAVVRPGRATLGRTARARLQWQRRATIGLSYEASFSYTGEEFDPGIGFAPRVNYTGSRDRLSYGWLADDASAVLSHVVGWNGLALVGNTTRRLETLETGPDWVVTFKSGASARVAAVYAIERLDEPLELSDDVDIPVGEYRFGSVSGFYQSPWGGLFRTSILAEAGPYYDGSRLSLTLSPAWTASKHLELSGDLVLNRVRFPGRNASFDGNIARLRAKVAFDTRLSSVAFVQYGSDDRFLTVNLRFRYNPREGNDLYLVFNEGLNNTLDRERPRLPRVNDRTILAKYSYTFLR